MSEFEQGSEYMRQEAIKVMNHLQKTAYDEDEVSLFEVIKGVFESIPAKPKEKN